MEIIAKIFRLSVGKVYITGTLIRTGAKTNRERKS